jgi:hypothetical protein
MLEPGLGRFKALGSAALAALLTVSVGACRGANLASGTWDGTTDISGSQPVPTQLDLADDGVGVTGTVSVTFFGGKPRVVADTLTGSRTGDSLHLVGSTGIVMDLARAGATLSGTVTFSFPSGAGTPVTGNLQVSR